MIDEENAEGAEVTQRTQRNTEGENDFSREIIGAAVEVQRVLGTGMLERAYSAALAIELVDRGLHFEQEAAITGHYKGRPLGIAYRADFIVERAVIVEVKAIEATTEVHRAQLLSYLRLSGLKLGLLINFHEFPVSKHVSRLVNRL
jgi:GxxExxY protein